MCTSTDTQEDTRTAVQPTYTEAPERSTNYRKVPGPCEILENQKPPATAVVDPSPAAADEEGSKATSDLEEPHRKEALKGAAVATRHEGRDRTPMKERRPGTRPELLRPWIEPRRRHVPRGSRGRSTHPPTTAPAAVEAP